MAASSCNAQPADRRDQSWGSCWMAFRRTYLSDRGARRRTDQRPRRRRRPIDALLAAFTTAPPHVSTCKARPRRCSATSTLSRPWPCDITGKVLMDRHAPAVCATALINRRARSTWLIKTGIATAAAAGLCNHRALRPPARVNSWPWPGACPTAHLEGLYLRTCSREPDRRGQWVAQLFLMRLRSYRSRHDRQLLTDRSVLAHGIWLDDGGDRTALANQAQIAILPVVEPVPGQRTVLGWARRAAGVAVNPGNDVGGGTSLSMLRTVADATGVQAWPAPPQYFSRRCCAPPRGARPRPAGWATRSTT